MRKEMLIALKTAIETELKDSWFTATKKVITASPRETEDVLYEFPVIFLAPAATQYQQALGTQRKKYRFVATLWSRGGYSDLDDIIAEQLDFVDFMTELFPRTNIVSFTCTESGSRVTKRFIANVLAEDFSNPNVYTDQVDMRISVPLELELL